MPPLPHLADLLHQLRTISQSLPLLEKSQGHNKPPIIDGDDGYDDAHTGDPTIAGLRVFKDAVGREVHVLEQFLAKSSTDRGPDLSTNAPYFVAVWNEILSAPPPIVAVGKIFEPPDGRKRKALTTGSAKPGGIKVDVVADEGRHWIRVNTMTNARLWAEFREMDSYLTDSEDDDDKSDDTNEPSTRPTTDTDTDQDTSLLRMGSALAAASAVPIAGTRARPRVTLRLTRLQPRSADGAPDARIAATMDALLGMGLDVQLGERVFRGFQRGDGERALGLGDPWRAPAELYATARVNVDLSMLIALVSDLSHAELPEGEEGAWARFWMPVGGRAGGLGGESAVTVAASGEDGERSKHSRALSVQCLQEMKHGLIDEVVGRLRVGPVEFWTTEGARDRCLQIVEKIGGEGEKRRARALFPAHPATDISRCREEFWRGSRYRQSYFTALLPIRIHAHGGRPRTVCSLFWGHLVQTCRHVLSQDAAAPHHPRARAQVTRVNPKLTVHTVESMLVGACEGMTTLTANKASVRALLREMRGVKYGCEDATTTAAAAACSRDGVDGVAAAVWIVEPRSLAEGMRADRLPTT